MKAAIVLFAALSVAAFQNADPETVHITFRPKAGMEAELKQVIADHWATATKLGLVQPEPHVTVEMKDDAGRPYFVDIFTWRDRDIPDNAPAAIMAIWADMNRLTETRGGRPGLDIKEVKLVPARASGMQERSAGGNNSMKVKEIMTRSPSVCAPETPLQEVATRMVGSDCGAVPVVGSTGTDGLVGIITDRDIVVRAIAEGRNPLTLTASACMTSPAITIREDASLEDCMELMESKKIRRVPVVDASGALAGIVAQADVARNASRQEAGELVRDVSAPTR